LIDSVADPGPPTLAIVVPCFNEQETIAFTVDTLLEHLDRMVAAGTITPRSFLFFVDDGSRDATWPLLMRACDADPRVLGLRLSRNFGHQAALLAGLTAVEDKADVSISIDADLQQEPEAMDRFVAAYRDGANVVLGVRRDRASDTAGKKLTASGFYWLMRRMGVDVVANHADYRLLDAKAMKALLAFPETALFIRGMTSLLGFDTRLITMSIHQMPPASYTETHKHQEAIVWIRTGRGYSIIEGEWPAVRAHLKFLLDTKRAAAPDEMGSP